jgi:hypothetical protein
MGKELWEDEARDRFVLFLHHAFATDYKTVDEDVEVSDGKNFDYLLEPVRGGSPPLALELFRLTPRGNELAQTRVWGQIVAELRAELQQKGIKGYIIRTPLFFVTRPKRQQFVREAAERIAEAVNAQPNSEEIHVGDYTLSRLVSLKGVEFMGAPSGGAFSSEGIASDCLDENIPWKNQQLAVENCTRVLLIVNWNPLADPSSVLLACSRFDFGKFPNIDQVFFEADPGYFHLAFDRSTRQRFDAKEITVRDLANPFVVSLIEARLSDRDRNALAIVKALDPECAGRLSADAHSHLIMMAQDMLKDDEIDEGLWIIRRFRDVQESTTRASMCWALHSLVIKNKPDFYGEILDTMERYADDADEDLLTAVAIPLVELAARLRNTNADGTPFISPGNAGRTKALAFKMLDGADGELADRLSLAFFYIRDMGHSDAKRVLETLAGGVRHQLEWIATLAVYFAVYRERQYQDLGAFDASWFKQFLIQSLRGARDDLRSTLVWCIWRGLSADIALDDMLAYLAAVPEGDFERSTFSHLYRIIGDNLAPGRREICALFLAALRREKDYLSIAGNQVWHFEEFFETVRKFAACSDAESVTEARQILDSVSDRLGVSRDHIQRLFA